MSTGCISCVRELHDRSAETLPHCDKKGGRGKFVFHRDLQQSPMRFRNAFAVLSAVLCIAAAPPEFEDIGISHDELASFLRLIKTAAATKDMPTLCHVLAYPIHVSNLYGSTTYLSEDECAQKYSAIFSPQLLKTISTVSESELSEIKTMVMVRDGQFWISKFWVPNSLKDLHKSYTTSRIRGFGK